MAPSFVFIATGLFLLIAALLLYLFFRLRKLHSESVQLRTEKTNYENICQQANDGMLVIDIADGRIHESNNRISEMLGYSREVLQKLTLFSLHPHDMLNQSSERIADVWEKGGLVYKDLPFITAAGELLPVECSARVAPFADRPAIVIYARDIRERLRLEKEIGQKNKAIRDSINYAKRIQFAMLPLLEDIRSGLPQSFVLLKPKDVVSGDFYWHLHHDNTIFIAAADCTGHGVPGALMSMIGNSFLTEIVSERKITTASKILDKLRENIIRTLRQKGEEGNTSDGMDIALCAINTKTSTLEFAGAFNPLYFIRNGELQEIKGDRFPIGFVQGKEDVKFVSHVIELKPGDSFYIFTDGYADQFGGREGKKFMYKQFKNLLLSIQDKKMKEQKEILEKTIESWRGEAEQIDDILIIGFRV